MISLHNLLILLFHFLVSVSANYAFNKPQVRVTTTFADFDARIMDQWGGGGGKFVKISRDSHHPFQGRTFGGAKRKEIRGTRAFGSGYPYGANDTTTVSGRPFPFGTWPLWWDQNFMGSAEYGPSLDAIRPGGMLVTVPLQREPEPFSVTNGELYHAIGDKESITLLMISYVTWCHVIPAWPSRFDPTSPNSTIHLENVVQYYRASSFAISSSRYNNTFARSPSSNATESTPLPASVENSPLHKCIDDVTFNALAILNKPPAATPLIKAIQALIFGGIFMLIAGVVIVSLLLILLRFLFFKLIKGCFLCLEVLLNCLCLLPRVIRDEQDRREEERAKQEAERKAYAAQRAASLAYERYP